MLDIPSAQILKDHSHPNGVGIAGGSPTVALGCLGMRHTSHEHVVLTLHPTAHKLWLPYRQLHKVKPCPFEALAFTSVGT